MSIVCLRRTPRCLNPFRFLSIGLSILMAGLTWGSALCSLAEAAEQRKIYFFHNDHLGSTTMVTDQQGQVVARAEYAPYGATVVQTGATQPAYRFTGQRLDTSTGLYFFNARYYDPQLGRFIQPDSLVQAPADPQTLNRYSYVRNNPLKYTDPSGHFFFLAFLGAVLAKAAIGAVVGAALNATVAAFTGADVGKAALIGAAGGAIFGAGSLVAGTAFAGQTAAAAIGRASIMASAGALAGTTGAGLSGQPLGPGAAIGAVLGFAGAVLPTPNISWLGNGSLGNVVNPAINNALMGAGFGAGVAAIQGESVARGALGGALLAGSATLAGGIFQNLKGISPPARGAIQEQDSLVLRIKHEHGGRGGRVAHIGTAAEIEQAIKVDLSKNPIELGTVNQSRYITVNGKLLKYKVTFTGEMTYVDVPTYYDPTQPKIHGKQSSQ